MLSRPQVDRTFQRFSLSGTVPAFTCDCLRFVCAFTRRRKFDLCVSTSSRTVLAFGNNVSFSSSECSTIAFCRRQHGRENVQTVPVDRKHSDCSKAPRNPQKVDLCVLASFSCSVYAETQGRKVRPVADFKYTKVITCIVISVRRLYTYASIYILLSNVVNAPLWIVSTYDIFHCMTDDILKLDANKIYVIVII